MSAIFTGKAPSITSHCIAHLYSLGVPLCGAMEKPYARDYSIYRADKIRNGDTSAVLWTTSCFLGSIRITYCESDVAVLHQHSGCDYLYLYSYVLILICKHSNDCCNETIKSVSVMCTDSIKNTYPSSYMGSTLMCKFNISFCIA